MPIVASSSPLDFAAQRRIMVDRQVRTFDVTDQPLLAQMQDLPREVFLPESLSSFAYSDSLLQIARPGGESRRLLAPMVLARLIQALRPQPGDRALDLAGGGGYGAALLAGLCSSVVSVESIPASTDMAAKAFAALQIGNARASTGALSDAGGESGPFDVILIEGVVETSPTRLLSLLSENGRLAAIYKATEDDSSGATCMATLWTRSGSAHGRAPLFNASGQLLADFARPAAFAF